MVICTGNICRSPMAEALLRARLAERGVDADVSSTGLVRAGNPATPEAHDAVRRFGLDLTAHRSRVLAADQIAGADLVVAMERRHAREAALLVPDAAPVTFTLKELARRAEATGPRAGTEPFDRWLARLDAGRAPVDQLGASPDDDVADPYGRSAAFYAACAAELDALISTVVDLAWPDDVRFEASA